MKLPEAFMGVMRDLLDSEADAFFASYGQPKTSGLRANGLKLAPGALPDMTDMARAPIPWVPDGCYTVEDDRPGWLLGAATKHRFEPSQAFTAGLRGDEAVRVLDLAIGHSDSIRFLKGETLQPAEAQLTGKGWTLVRIGGFPAGWGRWDGMTLKNERLPGWRWI